MSKPQPWTREQLDFLSEHYGLEGWNTNRIQAEMPGPRRSITALRQKAQYIGLADISRRGNWRHSAKLYEDIHDMAILDYTQAEIARALADQHGVEVSGEWVAQTMKKRMLHVYSRWASRGNQRRARGLREAYQSGRRKPAGVAGGGK